MSERLKEKLEAGQYYDYEQLVKTLFFKFKMKKKDAEMKALIKKSMEELNEHKQVGKQTIPNYSRAERFSGGHTRDILCRTREESSSRLGDRRLLGRDHRVCHQAWRAGSSLGCYRENR